VSGRFACHTGERQYGAPVTTPPTNPWAHTLSDHQPNFIHAADLHLGAPLDSLGSRLSHDPAKLSELRLLASKSFDRLVDLALERGSAFVVMAGDIYDRAEREVSSQLSLERGLRRLANDADSPIRVFMVHGNHDPLVTGFRSAAAMPPNVEVFASGEPSSSVMDIDGVGELTVSGVSYSSNFETENLVKRLVAAAPSDAGRLSIGVVHANVEGTTGHDPYAPCSRPDLEDSPIGYWALGHVHNRTVNQIGPGRWWAYPGNIQGRSTKSTECGAKGVLNVPITSSGFGEPEFIACDSIRFERLTVDVSGVGDIAAMVKETAAAATELAAAAGSRPVLVAVDLVGRTTFHKQLRGLDAHELVAQCREELSGALGHGEILRVRASTLPEVDLDQLLGRGDLLSELLGFINSSDSQTDDELDRWLLSDLIPELDHRIGAAIGEMIEEQSGRAGSPDSEITVARRLLGMSRGLLIDELYAGGEQP